MNDKNGFIITTRDEVFKAWDKSTELVRDFQSYAKDIKDNKEVADLFADYAKVEAQHSARFLEILEEYDKK